MQKNKQQIETKKGVKKRMSMPKQILMPNKPNPFKEIEHTDMSLEAIAIESSQASKLDNNEDSKDERVDYEQDEVIEKERKENLN